MMMIALSLLPMRGCFFREPTSVDSWTPGPKPLCHRHPTGPHPSGLLWTPVRLKRHRVAVDQGVGAAQALRFLTQVIGRADGAHYGVALGLPGRGIGPA